MLYLRGSSSEQPIKETLYRYSEKRISEIFLELKYELNFNILIVHNMHYLTMLWSYEDICLYSITVFPDFDQEY